MRVIPYDIQTNVAMSRKVLGAIKASSMSFFPRTADDLIILGEERYTDGADDLKGQLVFHIGSDKARFHVDVCSAIVPTKLYQSQALEANFMEFINMREFHRTMYARRGFKNGRITTTYEPRKIR